MRLIKWVKGLHFHKWELIEKITDKYGKELYFYKCSRCKKYKALVYNIPFTAVYITEDYYKMYKKYYNSLIVIDKLKKESNKRCRNKK